MTDYIHCARQFAATVFARAILRCLLVSCLDAIKYILNFLSWHYYEERCFDYGLHSVERICQVCRFPQQVCFQADAVSCRCPKILVRSISDIRRNIADYLQCLAEPIERGQEPGKVNFFEQP